MTAPESSSSHEAFTSAIGSATYAREELVAGIERIKRNLSRFIGEAECDELKRRQRQELVRSLEESHPDSLTTAEMGVENWNQGLPAEDHNLLDPRSAMPLQWSGEQGSRNWRPCGPASSAWPATTPTWCVLLQLLLVILRIAVSRIDQPQGLPAASHSLAAQAAIKARQLAVVVDRQRQQIRVGELACLQKP